MTVLAWSRVALAFAVVAPLTSCGSDSPKGLQQSRSEPRAVVDNEAKEPRYEGVKELDAAASLVVLASVADLREGRSIQEEENSAFVYQEALLAVDEVISGTVPSGKDSNTLVLEEGAFSGQNAISTNGVAPVKAGEYGILLLTLVEDDHAAKDAQHSHFVLVNYSQGKFMRGENGAVVDSGSEDAVWKELATKSFQEVVNLFREAASTE